MLVPQLGQRYLHFRSEESKLRAVRRVTHLLCRRGHQMLVFANTVAQVNRVTQALITAGIRAAAVHRHVHPQERAALMAAFAKARGVIVV